MLVSVVHRRQLGFRRVENSFFKAWSEQQLVQNFEGFETQSIAQSCRSTIDLAFSPNGSTLASTHGDHTIKLINFATGVVKFVLEGHPRTPWTADFHPWDPDVLVSACLAGLVKIWHIPSKTCTMTYQFPAESVAGVRFHPSGSWVCVAASSGVFCCSSVERKSPTSLLILEEHRIRSAMFNPSGDMLLIAAAHVYTMIQALPISPAIPVPTPEPRDDQFLIRPSRATPDDSVTRTPPPASRDPARPIPGPPRIAPHRLVRDPNVPRVRRAVRVPESDSVSEATVFLRRLFCEEGLWQLGPVVYTVPRVLAYTNAGIKISPCGRFFAGVVASGAPRPAYEIQIISLMSNSIGSCISTAPMKSGHAVTCIDFSPNSLYLIVGFGDCTLSVVELLIGQNAWQVVRIYKACDLTVVNTITSSEDEVNVVAFHRGQDGVDGFAYGTRTGRLLRFLRRKRCAGIESLVDPIIRSPLKPADQWLKKRRVVAATDTDTQCSVEMDSEPTVSQPDTSESSQQLWSTPERRDTHSSSSGNRE
eukprot:GILK01007196.1.p1 GENE.GILK01007196.1~~GILK01007196.1.p1  ORF type:complete len:533 (-),score=20.27 GILK01007196.1:158-1756(-)